MAQIARYSVVDILETATAADGTWYRIGPGRWAHSSHIGVVTRTARPEGVRAGDKWIAVNLAEQTLELAESIGSSENQIQAGWLLALIRPLWLRWIYRAWMRFGLLAGRVMTPLVLGIVFFAMISPMAIVRRLMGKDPMQRTLDPDQKSYRVQSLKSPAEKLEKPF